MELHKIDPDQDCKFWMEGFCKFEATNCGRGSHNIDKFNTTKRDPSKAEMMSIMQEMIKKQKEQPMNQSLLMMEQPQMKQ